jgi:hypothetical protein
VIRPPPRCPCFRATSARSAVYALGRKLVELHGGLMSLTSGPDDQGAAARPPLPERGPARRRHDRRRDVRRVQQIVQQRQHPGRQVRGDPQLNQPARSIARRSSTHRASSVLTVGVTGSARSALVTRYRRSHGSCHAPLVMTAMVTPRALLCPVARPVVARNHLRSLSSIRF